MEAEEEREWLSATMDNIADSKSIEEATAIIDYSNAGGMDKKQLEGLALQIHKPEAFKEDIRDWKQAYDEVISGKIQSADDLIQRWGGILSNGTLQSFIKTFYQQQKSGGTGGKKDKGPNYVGYSWSDTIKKKMEELKLEPGTQDGALFITTLGDEKDAREKKKGADLTPVELTDLINEFAKKHVVQKGAFGGTQIPEYQRKLAEENGFRWSAIGWVKELPDGTVVMFDPKQYQNPDQAKQQEQAATPAAPAPADVKPQPPVSEPTPPRKPAESPEEAYQLQNSDVEEIPEETWERWGGAAGGAMNEVRTTPAAPQPPQATTQTTTAPQSMASSQPTVPRRKRMPDGRLLGERQVTRASDTRGGGGSGTTAMSMVSNAKRA